MSNGVIQRGHLAEREREKEVWAVGISINLGIGTFIQVAANAHSTHACEQRYNISLIGVEDHKHKNQSVGEKRSNEISPLSSSVRKLGSKKFHRSR